MIYNKYHISVGVTLHLNRNAQSQGYLAMVTKPRAIKIKHDARKHTATIGGIQHK